MTLVERLREKANMYVEDIMDESADRLERYEAALREIATQCEHMAAAEVFDPDWVIDIARKALGEE